MIECNIDDMNGEIYSYLMDMLFELGAKDVTYESIFMKKNRPATKISVLAPENVLSRIEDFILVETTTFGIRKYEVERTILERRFETRDTELGEVVFKFGYKNQKLIKVTPEYESLKRIATETKMPLRQVYEKINAIIGKEMI